MLGILLYLFVLALHLLVLQLKVFVFQLVNAAKLCLAWQFHFPLVELQFLRAFLQFPRCLRQLSFQLLPLSLQAQILLLGLLQLPIEEEVQTGHLLRHLRAFLLLAAGGVLEDLDAPEEAIDEVDALDNIIGDVLPVHPLAHHQVAQVGDGAHLCPRGVLGELLVIG